MSPTRIVMGGHQDKLVDFDLMRGLETNYVRKSHFYLVTTYRSLTSYS